MRFAATVLLVSMAWIWPAATHAEGSRLHWPVSPRPAVTRGFDAPSPNWHRGHRGVDLAAVPDQPIHAAGPGTVVFAGVLAGRPVVSLAHPGGLRTSYEPVQAAVRPGQTVAAGQLLGTVLAGHPGCPVPACLHWGAMWGAAARADYVDPLALLPETPIRLKPLR
ncbi:M23 family metallopeptidase [Mycolicibacterium alvei]|jgi:murein DD-endopeptidase MepM/ murein hydrolase activator NlpD|nr:M23 family metallopeptidase [Mycolicibacterium alvei]MCV6999055.1 M23 family metallopeptidase [Mycolicibacterium alvei]